MIRLARKRGIDVLLIGTPEPGPTMSRPPSMPRSRRNSAYRTKARVSANLRDASLKSDQVYPNAQGYRLMAERVYALLKNAGAL
jgi:lysophospholipase L1-like esterase